MIKFMNFLQHYKLSNSQMLQLLQDPETLPFRQGKNINLSILRKEINRRVIKIKKMIDFGELDRLNDVVHCGSQTQNIQLNGQSPRYIKQIQILSPKKPSEDLPLDSNQKHQRYTARCSLPVRKLNEKTFEQNVLIQSTRHRVSQYLLTARAWEKGTFNQVTQRLSSKKQNNDGMQYDTITQNNEYHDFFNSLRNRKKNSELYMERSGFTHIPLPLAIRNLEQNVNFSQFDYEDSDCHFMRANSILNRTLSGKKLKFTERTALQQQKRFVITQELMQKMNCEIEQFVTKKRRQIQDNKLRENIFKKIEQKYGDYFDNI